MSDSTDNSGSTNSTSSPAGHYYPDSIMPRQDVTHQSLSIARVIDRLSPGSYQIELTRGSKSSVWRLLAFDDTGTTAADLIIPR